MNAVRDCSPDLRDQCSSELYQSLSAAKARIIAYWVDECARNLDNLLTHFTLDAEVVTPDDSYRGHEAVAALYQKSFDAYPGLTVDVTGTFPGSGAHCIEYSAVLTDAHDHRFLVEGINLMRMKDGLISYLRSFEDAPRRIPGAAS